MPKTLEKGKDSIAEAAARSGSYPSEEEFIEDAIRTFLAGRKDLRIDIAAELYKEDKVSIGRACEIAELGRERMKEELNKRGIEIRRGPKNKSELKKNVEELLGSSG